MLFQRNKSALFLVLKRNKSALFCFFNAIIQLYSSTFAPLIGALSFVFVFVFVFVFNGTLMTLIWRITTDLFSFSIVNCQL